MKNSTENHKLYLFKNTKAIDGINYHYVSSKALKKQGLYKVQDSYTSDVIDLNDNKRIALIIHMHTIKKAIEYAKRQYLQGVSEKMHIPLPELTKPYFHRVWMAAVRLAEFEKNGISKDTYYKSSQPFWVDQNAILTYGFRQDKNLSSKYQCFVEFVNANRTQKSIKLNLRMSNSAYNHMNELYLDGFDLVQKPDRSFSIRHVKQSLVKPKELTGIDKLLFIDKWLNMYTVEVDKTAVNEDGKPFYNEEGKIVNGFIYKSHKSGKLNRLIMALASKLSAKRYKDVLHRFEMSLKARLSREIGADNEDNITLLLPTYHHKTANNINVIVERIVRDLCLRRGLKLKIIIKDDSELNKLVEQHKKQCSKKSKYQFRTAHTKWQEYAYALMLLKYRGFYPYLRNTRKSSAKTVRDIPQKDVEEFSFEELEQYIDVILANVGMLDETSYLSRLVMRYNDFVNEQTKQRRIAEGTYVPEPEFV